MQTNKLYVGNLNYAVTSDDLQKLFATYGEVVSSTVIEGKGFGFVEMANQAAAEEARKTLNDQEFRGRPLKVDIARPPKPRTGGGGYRNDDSQRRRNY